MLPLPQGQATPYPKVFQAGFVLWCPAHTPRVLGLGFQLGLWGTEGRLVPSFSGSGSFGIYTLSLFLWKPLRNYQERG